LEEATPSGLKFCSDEVRPSKNIQFFQDLGSKGFNLVVNVANDVLPHGISCLPCVTSSCFLSFHVVHFGVYSGIEASFKVLVVGVCHGERETQEWGGWVRTWKGLLLKGTTTISEKRGIQRNMGR
jgi:hypothetical protein